MIFIIIKDMPNGERLYWNEDVCWVQNRDSATEYYKRPHTIPHGSKVFEYDEDNY